MTRNLSSSSRDRPASPGGPRTPTKKHRTPHETVHPAPDAGPTGNAPTGARPVPKRGRTYDHIKPIKYDNGTDFLQQPQRASSQRQSSRPRSTDISRLVLPPIPTSAPCSPTRHSYVPPQEHQLPLVTAPKTPNPDLQKAMDHIAEKVNDLVMADIASTPRARKASVAYQDKENQSFGEEGWSYVREEELRSPVLSSGRTLGREVGNLSVDGKGKKENRRSKPPPLDFSPLARKPSNYCVVNSSDPMSPTPISSRKLSSPAVGEFKGWFSNLFGWKNQHGAETGILYSPHDLAKTRNEVGRQLQALGVLVDASGIIMSDDGDEYVLRCQVHETNPIASVNLNAKNLRFRVEFMSAQSGMANPLTPNTNLLSTAPLPRGRGSMLPLKSAPQNPLLSPRLSGSPAECSTAIILVHEKGSVSTFKAVWKKLKATFADIPSQYPCMSPMIGSTPILENPHKFST